MPPVNFEDADYVFLGETQEFPGHLAEQFQLPLQAGLDPRARRHVLCSTPPPCPRPALFNYRPPDTYQPNIFFRFARHCWTHSSGGKAYDSCSMMYHSVAPTDWQSVKHSCHATSPSPSRTWSFLAL